MGKFTWTDGDLELAEVAETPLSARERRRREVVAARRLACARACDGVLSVPELDVALSRKLLEKLAREATKPAWRGRITLRSTGALGVTSKQAREQGDPLNIEHVVPVRVLVERLLLGDPAEAVFDSSLLALVRRSEHRRIGPLVKNHGEVYEQMVDPTTPLSELGALGRQRYARAGIELVDVPGDVP